jgi:hypothetical protein
MTRNTRWVLILTIIAVTAAGVAVWLGSSQTRQAEVAAKGRQIMPFDLERTTHRFTKTATGGIQDVVADDPTDADQVRLVREHLTKESARFARGDFGDPAAIHGTSMPGLAELSTGYQRIATGYSEQPDGARITYTIKDTKLIAALHAWFDAQMSDHGSHAEHGNHAEHGQTPSP